MKHLPALILGLAAILIPQLMISGAVDGAVDSALQSLGRQVTAAIHATTPADNCGFELHPSIIVDPVNTGLGSISLSLMAVLLFSFTIAESVRARTLMLSLTKPPPSDILSRSRRYRF
jgi:hypothetical protein